MIRLLLIAMVACSSRTESVAEPVRSPPPVTDAPAAPAVAPNAPVPVDAAVPTPATLHAIQAIEPDGAFSKITVGIGKRDGVTTAWRIRLVRKDGTVEPDHVVVIVRIDERRLIARTKFPPAAVSERFDRVDARPD